MCELELPLRYVPYVCMLLHISHTLLRHSTEIPITKLIYLTFLFVSRKKNRLVSLFCCYNVP